MNNIYLSSDLVNHAKEEKEEIRNGLLVYCGLDTLAMVKVWEKLKETEGDIYAKNDRL